MCLAARCIKLKTLRGDMQMYSLHILALRRTGAEMKRVISMVMVLICFVVITACGKGEKKVFEPEKPVKETFALINSETVVQGLIKDRADLIEMQWKEKS